MNVSPCIHRQQPQHFETPVSLSDLDEALELADMRRGDDEADANRPLIADGRATQDDPDSRPATQISLSNAGPVIRFLTLSAGLSGLLFGFDTAVMSSTLVSIGSDLSHRPLTTQDKSIVTAITSLLALIAAPSTGYFADRFGRKSVITVPALLFALGAIVQAFANYVWTMVVGRALVGAAVGVASGAVPLYLTELAPAELRGRLITMNSLFITGGQVVAYLIGWGFAALPHGWRYMVGIGAVPAVLQLCLLLRMPETPRWLLQTGQDVRARKVLHDIYTTLPENYRAVVVQHVLARVQSEILAEDKIQQGGSIDDEDGNGHRALIKELVKIPANRRALMIACMLQGFQQLCGFNSFMYFSATIFSLVGFRSPIGTSLCIALTNFVFTMVAFAYIDTVGRRNILLRSVPFMVAGLAACSVAFMFIRPNESATSEAYELNQSGAWSIVLLVSMILYVAAYAVGLGCVPWQQSELFPLRVRSLGSGVATATNWSSNFLIGMTFLPMMSSVGSSTTFALYAFICIAGWFCIWAIYPETAGLELEDIGQLLEDGFGVVASTTTFQERRKAVLNSVRRSSP